MAMSEYLFENNDEMISDHDLLTEYLEAVMVRLGELHDNVDFENARDFIERFGCGNIVCSDRLWNIIKANVVPKEKKSYIRRMFRKTSRNVQEVDIDQMDLTEVEKEDLRSMVRFVESYDEVREIWRNVLYKRHRNFTLTYTLGEPGVREILLEKGKQVGIDRFIAAHYEHGVPISDLFSFEDEEDQSAIYRAGC